MPDHCTIARFRSNPKLQGAFEDLFFQYIALLEKKGLTEHAEVFVDGTKIESKANKYTFVWLKQVLKQLEKVKGKLKELIAPEGNLTLSKVGAKLEELNSEIISQGIEVKKDAATTSRRSSGSGIKSKNFAIAGSSTRRKKQSAVKRETVIPRPTRMRHSCT